jgi:hypothetical protein
MSAREGCDEHHPEGVTSTIDDDIAKAVRQALLFSRIGR